MSAFVAEYVCDIFLSGSRKGPGAVVRRAEGTPAPPPRTTATPQVRHSPTPPSRLSIVAAEWGGDAAHCGRDEHFVPRATGYCIECITVGRSLSLCESITPAMGRAWRHRLLSPLGTTQPGRSARYCLKAPKDA